MTFSDSRAKRCRTGGISPEAERRRLGLAFSSLERLSPVFFERAPAPTAVSIGALCDDDTRAENLLILLATDSAGEDGDGEDGRDGVNPEEELSAGAFEGELDWGCLLLLEMALGLTRRFAEEGEDEAGVVDEEKDERKEVENDPAVLCSALPDFIGILLERSTPIFSGDPEFCDAFTGDFPSLTVRNVSGWIAGTASAVS